MKTSIVCGVMNRLAYLQRALPTWLACPEVNEIVVVDWSSRASVQYSDLPADKRVQIVRVVGQQKHWVLSKCCNLGIRLATGDLVLRLDADDLVDPSFVREHPIAMSGTFYRADPTKMLREEDVHLSGVVYAPRSMLLGVNGYNERLLTYGCDDVDLVARLMKAGNLACTIDYSLISHIPHTDEERTVNQVIDARLGGSWMCRLGPIYRSMDANAVEVVTRPWGRGDEMVRWQAFHVDDYLVCSETEDVPMRYVENFDGVFMVDYDRKQEG